MPSALTPEEFFREHLRKKLPNHGRLYCWTDNLGRVAAPTATRKKTEIGSLSGGLIVVIV